MSSVDIYPSTAAEAKALGLDHYDTKKPCKYGHYSKRSAVNSSCLECQRLAAQKRHASRTPEQQNAINAWQREYYMQHHEERKQALRDSHRKHKEKRSKERTARYRQDIDLSRELNRQHYQSNKHDLRFYMTYKLRSSRHRAKKKGLEFDLTVDYLMSIFPADGRCPVFGVEFLLERAGMIDPNSLSLDRIDNSKGYVQGNVWFISNRANTIKNSSTLEELELLVSAIKACLQRANDSQNVDCKENAVDV